MYDDADPFSDQLKELSIEVQFLLSHLQRLPETRIAKYFKPSRIQQAEQDGTPQPPTHDLGYFLSRLGRLACIYQNGEAAEPIEPPAEPEEADASGLPKSSGAKAKSQDPGPKLTDYAFLMWSRDFLAAITYPASVQTIKVTRAFREHRAARRGLVYLGSAGTQKVQSAGLPIDETSFRFGGRLAALVQRYRFYTGCLIVFSIWAAVIVYSGNVLVRENDSLQKRFRELQTEIVRADRSSQSGQSIETKGIGLPNKAQEAMCRPAEKVTAICDDPMCRIGSLCCKQAELDTDIEAWKAFAARWQLAVSPITLPLFALPQKVGAWFHLPAPNRPSNVSLKTSRYVMEQFINGLLGAVLPVCYASLGALAALFRRLNAQVETETLSASELGGMPNSLILGVLTGSVIGIFGDIVQTNHGQALPISTTALSLLAGFASDRVFTTLDAAAERVFGRNEETRLKARL